MVDILLGFCAIDNSTKKKRIRRGFGIFVSSQEED